MKNILYKNVNIPEGYNDHIVSLINQIADNEIININNNINYQENMSGIEYEVLCSSILVKNSWKVMRTKVTGDQGVDLIAEKHHYRVAIQCKRCSSKIGNSAVQEIVAGKKYYNANYALVVSNSDFTQSAKKLALINNVYLIHHVMLNNLEGIL